MPTSSKNGKRSLGRTGAKYLAARKKLMTISQICHRCGEFIDITLTDSHDPMYFTADHYPIPVKELARDDPRLWSLDNLKPAHMGCNSKYRNDEPKQEHPTSRNWRQ